MSLDDHNISCLRPEGVLVKFTLHEEYGFLRFTASHSLTHVMLYRSLIFANEESLSSRNMQYKTIKPVST
jgi:hypothetical protein